MMADVKLLLIPDALMERFLPRTSLQQKQLMGVCIPMANQPVLLLLLRPWTS